MRKHRKKKILAHICDYIFYRMNFETRFMKYHFKYRIYIYL